MMNILIVGGNLPAISKSKQQQLVSVGKTVISVVGWAIIGIMMLLLLLGVISGVLKK